MRYVAQILLFCLFVDVAVWLVVWMLLFSLSKHLIIANTSKFTHQKVVWFLLLLHNTKRLPHPFSGMSWWRHQFFSFFCSVFSLLLFNIIVASFDFISWTYLLCMNWIGKKWDARQLKIVYIFFVLVFIFTERIQFCFISPISYYLYLYSYLNVYVMFSCVHITLMGNSNESKAQQQQQQQHLQIVYIGQATIRCHSSLLNV